MLGAALRQALSARKQRVLQLVRSTSPGAGQLQWDPVESPAFERVEALEGLMAAIHLSGSNIAGRRWSKAYKQELTASRVQSTRTLAGALASLRQPPRTLLVASATGFYGDRGAELLDETSAAGSGFLAELCQQWEAAAQPAVEAGIRVVHLRFGVILGPGDGALGRMTPLFRLGLGGPLGTGKQWMSWISLRDTLAAILFALETPELAGPVNLTAPNPVTNAEFTRVLAGQLHRPALLRAPAFALRLGLGEMVDQVLLASARAYPSKLTNAGFHFTDATVRSALAEALKA
jgi:hypothetical protein